MTPTVVLLVEQDAIDEHPELLRELLDAVLGLDLDEVLVTDASQLSDFTGCYPADIANAADPATAAATGWRGARAQWDSWVLARFRDHFGFIPEGGVASLLTTLLDDIVEQRAHKPLH